MVTLRKIYNDPRLFKNKILKEDLKNTNNTQLSQNLKIFQKNYIQFSFIKIKTSSFFRKIKEKISIEHYNYLIRPINLILISIDMIIYL